VTDVFIATIAGLSNAHGPFKFELQAENTASVNNAFSWNKNTNVLYIDQPFGDGFSRGHPLVKSTESTVP
jgi:carboxypeptidase C (cathepsin A)